jgi:hypothetical protein
LLEDFKQGVFCFYYFFSLLGAFLRPVLFEPTPLASDMRADQTADRATSFLLAMQPYQLRLLD